MRRALIVLPLAGLGLTECALRSNRTTPYITADEQRAVPSVPNAPILDITLEHLADAGSWRATYSLSQAVRMLRFMVPERASRAKHWRFLEPEGIHIVEGRTPNSNEGEQLEREDGAAFTRIVVEITSDTEKPEKAYQPVIPFADNGFLFFTGQLNAVPCSDVSTCAPDTAVKTRLALVPAEGERLIVSGSDQLAAARWEGSNQGTYVYFGSLEPIRTPYLTAVVDRAFPEWLKKRVEDLLPKLFEYYAKGTGHSSTTRPLVFLSYGDDPHPSSRTMSGGTLPGVIQQEVRLGTRFRSENDSAVASDVAHSVAHEAAHWWNGRIFANDAEGRGGSWLHEGGAEAFADRALRDLHIETLEDYHRRLSEALSLCTLGLRGEPLSASSRPGRFKNYYTCGSVIALWTEAAMSTREPREDLLAFWKRVFDAVVKEGARGGYDNEMYYRALAFRSPQAAVQIKHFVEDAIADPAEMLRSALAANGVGVVYNDGAATPLYSTLAAIRAGEIVAAGDGCEGVYAARKSQGSVVIEASGCRTFARKAAFAAVAGVSLARDPLRAWEMLSNICSKKEQVNVMLETERVEQSVACPRSVPERARYLQITHAPFDGAR